MLKTPLGYTARRYVSALLALGYRRGEDTDAGAAVLTRELHGLTSYVLINQAGGAICGPSPDNTVPLSGDYLEALVRKLGVSELRDK